MRIALLMGEDERQQLAGEALGEAIRLSCAHILDCNVSATAEVAITALGTFVAQQIRPESDGVGTATLLGENLRTAILSAVDAIRLQGTFSAEALAAAKTLSMGLPINAEMRARLTKTTLINRDGTVNLACLAALEELHRRGAAKKEAAGG